MTDFSSQQIWKVSEVEAKEEEIPTTFFYKSD